MAIGYLTNDWISIQERTFDPHSVVCSGSPYSTLAPILTPTFMVKIILLQPPEKHNPISCICYSHFAHFRIRQHGTRENKENRTVSLFHADIHARSFSPPSFAPVCYVTFACILKFLSHLPPRIRWNTDHQDARKVRVMHWHCSQTPMIL